MDSTRVPVKNLAKELMGVGKKLQALPSSVDELLILIEKAESILTKVDQQPPGAIESALVPLMQMLITNEIMHHANVNIQIAAACCFTELTRINAPRHTYGEAEMKEYFKLCILVLKHLSSESGRSYCRALRMLETIARLNLYTVTLDLDGDELLIVEMFQIFFSAIRPNHPADAFRHMEMITSYVIRESHKISFKLLRPLLDSVKLDNKNISPISWELGNAVFGICSEKLQRPLKKIVRAKNLDVAEYSIIIASLCQGEPSKENMIGKEVGSTDRTSKSGDLSINEPEDFNPCAKTASRGVAKKKKEVKKYETSDAKKRTRSHLGSGENLIDSRIKVWWPEDSEYYPGTIVSFDHVAKKHKIVYDDGDEEILFMDEETWEPLDGHQIQDSMKHDTDSPAPAKKLFVSQKKKGKSKLGPSKKQKASSASERAKVDKGGIIKSGDVSVPIGGVNDQPDTEMSDMDNSKKNDEKAETLVTETQPSDRTTTLDVEKD